MRQFCFRRHAAPSLSSSKVQTSSKTSTQCFLSLMHRKYSISSFEPDPRRIHILGLGNVGLFIAHALAKKPDPPPITLLFHRKGLFESWKNTGRKISVNHNDEVSTSSDFDIEEIGTNGSMISNLIVATKAMNTLDPMKSIGHRLDASSTVLFAQNGMGVISSLKDNLEDFQSTCLSAIITHGLNRTKEFHTNVAGLGQITLGQSDPPHEGEGDLTAPNAQYLAGQILSTKLLNATLVDSTELHMMQLDKLAVNAIINPITAIFRVKNGALIEQSSNLGSLAVALLMEMMPVLQEALGPAYEARSVDFHHFADTIIKVAATTAENKSSMLQDVLAGRDTEIDYINGWIVQQALKSGLKCELHEKVIELVKVGLRDGAKLPPLILSLCNRCDKYEEHTETLRREWATLVDDTKI